MVEKQHEFNSSSRVESEKQLAQVVVNFNKTKEGNEHIRLKAEICKLEAEDIASTEERNKFETQLATIKGALLFNHIP